MDNTVVYELSILRETWKEEEGVEREQPYIMDKKDKLTTTKNIFNRAGRVMLGSCELGSVRYTNLTYSAAAWTVLAAPSVCYLT